MRKDIAGWGIMHQSIPEVNRVVRCMNAKCARPLDGMEVHIGGVCLCPKCALKMEVWKWRTDPTLRLI